MPSHEKMMNEPTEGDEDVPDVTERDWKWAEWCPSDSTVYYADGRIEKEPGGWDHDHCLDCHATLSNKGNALRFAFHDAANDDWLCPACYERLISPPQKPREGKEDV